MKLKKILLYMTAMLVLTSCSGKETSDTASGSTTAEGQANAETQASEIPVDLKSSTLRLIDFYPYEGNTFLVFAFLGPGGDVSMYLENSNGEERVTDLPTVGMKNGWKVKRCFELPGGCSLDNLQLNVTNYDTDEKAIFSDWGDPMTVEEMENCGIYDMEGYYMMVGSGRKYKGRERFGIQVGYAPVGRDGQLDTPVFENAAELFHFYAADGTPLEEYLDGFEMTVYTGEMGNIYAEYSAPEGTDIDAQLNKLSEAEPYLEFTGTNGRTIRFTLGGVIRRE